MGREGKGKNVNVRVVQKMKGMQAGFLAAKEGW